MRNLHTIRIQNGRIWDGRRFLEGDVLVKDGRIAAVGGSPSGKADFTYDASGCLVTPGLVDIHVHLRGVSIENFGTPGEAVCFPNGVTAAADAGAGEEHPEAGELLNTFMLKNTVFLQVNIRDNRPDFTRTQETLARFGDRVAGLKVYFDTSGGQVRDGEPLRQVCGYARERGLRVMVHSTGSPVPMAELLGILQPGDICTHAFHGGPNSVRDDGFRSIRAAKERGVVIDGGFAGGVHVDFDVFREAVAAGVLPDTISTDITKLSAFVRGGNYGLNLCMTLARALGMTEEAILPAVTSRAAAAVGREDQWGILEPGRAADVAVLRYGRAPYAFAGTRWGNSLAGETGYRCLMTLLNGETVYRDPEF